jgi:hypothetical protein
LLRTAGIAADEREIVTAYGAAAVLQMDDVPLPVLALPAILGAAAINHSLRLRPTSAPPYS